MRKSTKICAALGVVAGLGVAVAPLSVFADTPTRTDTLNITVNLACTVNTKQLTETESVTNTYNVTLDPGHEEVFTPENADANGKETGLFTIECNDPTGYKIVANPTNPTGQDTTNTGITIPAGTAISGNTSYWAASISVTGNLTADLNDSGEYAAITTSGQKVAHNDAGSAAGGDSFYVNYKAGASTALKAGHYRGQVAYTLVQGAN